MIQSETFLYTGTFLPDTQMSILEKEQLLLRSSLPHEVHTSPFPPFCFSRLEQNQKKLYIQAPIACDGWIIRPVGDVERPCPHLIQFPLFPPLPKICAFILGYAGEFAERLCGELTQKTGISVNVWYYADISLSLSHEENSFYSCEYSIGKPQWVKRT